MQGVDFTGIYMLCSFNTCPFIHRMNDLRSIRETHQMQILVYRTNPANNTANQIGINSKKLILRLELTTEALNEQIPL